MWFAIFVCTALVLTYFAIQKDRVKVGIRELVLNRFEPSTIDKIEISGAQQILLLKVSNVWNVSLDINDAKKTLANAEYVADLFQGALGIQSAYFATERVDKQSEFQVSDDKATKIVLYSNQKPVWALLVGSEAVGGGRYVRAPGSKSIFVAKGRFADLTRSLVDDWRERKILPLAKEKLTKLIFKKSSVHITMALEKSHWKIQTSNAPVSPRVDEERVFLFAEALINLRALRFVELQEEKNIAEKFLKSPLIEISVYEGSGSFYELLVALDTQGQKAWAQLKGGNQIYEISQYAVERLDLVSK